MGMSDSHVSFFLIVDNNQYRPKNQRKKLVKEEVKKIAA